MTEQNTGEGSIDPRETYWNEDWIREQYFEKGKTTEEIGEMVGVSSSTISRWARKHDIDLSRNESEQVSELLNWIRLQVEDELEAEERIEIRNRQSELLERMEQIRDEENKALEHYASQHGYDFDEIGERMEARTGFRETQDGKEFENRRDAIVNQLSQEYRDFLHRRFAEPSEVSKKNRICTVMRAFGLDVNNEALAKATGASRSYISEFGASAEITVSSNGVVTRHFQHEDFSPGDPPVILQREPRGGSSLSSSLRESVLERDNHECQRCGTTENLEAHHIVPVSHGGSDEKDNLAILCQDCHKEAVLTRSVGGDIPAYPKGEFEAWLDDNLDICGAKTNDGLLCRNPKGSCPHHE